MGLRLPQPGEVPDLQGLVLGGGEQPPRGRPGSVAPRTHARNPKTDPHPRLQDFPRWKNTLTKTQENIEWPGGWNWEVGISFGLLALAPARTRARGRRLPQGRPRALRACAALQRGGRYC